MPDYNQQQVAGTSWQRCGCIIIVNPRPHLGVPAVTFVEEQVMVLDGEEIIRPLGNLVEPFTSENAAEEFAVRDPATDEVVGTCSYQRLYVLLASAYRHVAEKRDAPQAEA